MTDTSLVQGEFAPADTSFAADISVQSSPSTPWWNPPLKPMPP